MPFSYRVAADGRVFISWSGRVVITLAGAEARRLARRLERSVDPRAAQLLLAKATGNFKRGNERTARRR